MILKFIFIAWLGLSAIGRVLLIDEERKPITKQQAAIATLIDIIIVVCLLKFL